MKQKYYIRGLGVGILITALVFGFLNSPGISDEEAIKRAEELGYVLATEVTPGINLEGLLSSSTPKPTKTPVPTESQKVTEIPEVTDDPEPTKMPEPTEAPQETVSPTETITPTPVPTQVPEATAMPTVTEALTPSPTEVPVIKAQISVVRGSSASQVCKILEEAGIIADWEQLRQYFIENNLVDYINIGTFELSSDMSFKEIAHILTGK